MKGKKSIFYTSAAIALTVVIFVIYSSYSALKLNDKMDAVQSRIETVNFFIKDVEKDINNGAYIAGFRTFLSFNQLIASNGTYIIDLNKTFEESFLNGTVNGLSQTLMDDSTFADWSNKISEQADKIDINFNFTINKIGLEQQDPWSVNINLNLSLYIQDKKGVSSWNREKMISSKISIAGFEDPLYLVGSTGRVSNAIVPTSVTTFVSNGDMANLLYHMNGSYYIAHNDSPSFLMRLGGEFGNSTYGIESLVNIEKFQQQGLAVYDRSIVDSVYFGTQTTTNHRINSTPEWFKIDDAHLEVYQVANWTIS
ncbi:MAG: hypothetical protein AABX00_04415 [Nanoarchaeota archaeon]